MQGLALRLPADKTFVYQLKFGITALTVEVAGVVDRIAGPELGGRLTSRDHLAHRIPAEHLVKDGWTIGSWKTFKSPSKW